MMKKIAAFLRREVVFTASLVAALASMAVFAAETLISLLGA